MLLLLLPALSFAAAPAPAMAPAVPGAPPDAVHPWDTLVQGHPALATALLARNPDDVTLAEVTKVLADADARLVNLLIAAMPGGALPDARGEAEQVDLVDADVWLEGTLLKGIVRGRGVAENGVWLDLDLENGPAPDLRLGFGRGWTRAHALDGGGSPASGPLPTLGTDRISFTLDLADSGRLARQTFGRGLAGSAIALLKSPDGRLEDIGPAGLLGPAPDEGVDVLLALVQSGPITDSNLAVSLAVTFGAVRPLVADTLVSTVDSDAVAWLRYGESLDAWLAAAGARWRFGSLDPLGKLTWAWPAAQAIVYGTVNLAGERQLLDADQYRFVVPDTDTLARLRARAPFAPTAVETARNVDRAVNNTLRYRAPDALMDALCRAGTRTEEECAAWRLERRNKADLGTLGGIPVPLWDGVSATWQLGVFAREATFVGDCATATALTIGTLQALGIPAIGIGWSGADFTTPTHDVPLWYDGATFRATQRGPGPAWGSSTAFVYVTLPGIHPVNAWTIGREPGGWSRGGAVVGGWATYAALTQLLRDGLPGRRVEGWLDVQAAGGWPTY